MDYLKDLQRIELEFKTIKEIAAHFPRREKREDGAIVVGANRATIAEHIRTGRLQLTEYWFKGHQYYHVPVEDQLKDRHTWCLEKRYKSKKRGRPTNRSRIGLE